MAKTQPNAIPVGMCTGSIQGEGATPAGRRTPVVRSKGHGIESSCTTALSTRGVPSSSGAAAGPRMASAIGRSFSAPGRYMHYMQVRYWEPHAHLERWVGMADAALPPGAPVLILANKVDLPQAASQEELYYALGLDELAQFISV